MIDEGARESLDGHERRIVALEAEQLRLRRLVERLHVRLELAGIRLASSTPEEGAPR